MNLTNLTVLKNGFIAVGTGYGEEISIALNFKNVTDICLRKKTMRINQSANDTDYYVLEFDEKDSAIHDNLISLMVAFAEYGGQ